MRLRSVTATAIALLAIMISANPVRAAQGTGLPPEMLGVEWALASLEDAPGNLQDTTGEGLTIRFDADGTVFGSGGCNTFRGSYTAGAAQELTLGPLISTLIGCEQAIADREAAYLQALGSVSAYSLDGAGRLELTFGGGQGTLSYTGGQPAALPQTGGADGSAALLALFGLLCCVAGLWLHRRRFAPSRVD